MNIRIFLMNIGIFFMNIWVLVIIISGFLMNVLVFFLDIRVLLLRIQICLISVGIILLHVVALVPLLLSVKVLLSGVRVWPLIELILLVIRVARSLFFQIRFRRHLNVNIASFCVFFSLNLLYFIQNFWRKMDIYDRIGSSGISFVIIHRNLYVNIGIVAIIKQHGVGLEV